MVPIINELLITFHEKRINSIKTKINFNENYLPIKLQNITEKSEKKIKFLTLKAQERILPFEIAAGVESDYLKGKYNFHLDKINDKYYWKERAVKASASRKNLDPKDQVQTLLEEKNLEIKKLNNIYFPATSNDAKTEYNNQKAVIENELNSKVSLITETLNKKIAVTEALTQSKIDKLIVAKARLNEKLEKLTSKKEERYSLDQDVVLSIKNLSMHFGGLKAVDNLSFDVKEGEIFGLIGPNGAGKTTVFNCITRFYRPNSGEMYFKNIYGEVVHLNDKQVHNIIKEGIVRTFQNVEIVWELNVVDNLLVAAHTIYRSGFFGHLLNSRLLRQEEKVMRKKAEQILEDLSLGAYKYAYPLGLPYGILKKIELARTLMANPKLIILDEPAAGLNDAETDNLAKIIKKIQKDYNTTIFLVEHDMGLVMEICDTVCAISFGKKLAMGTPKEIQNSKIVQEAYLGGE